MPAVERPWLSWARSFKPSTHRNQPDGIWWVQGCSTKAFKTGICWLLRFQRSSRDHFMLGKAYEAEHDYPKAIAELKETIRLDPTHERAHYVLAQIYERTGEKQLAQAEFEAHNRIKKGERNAQYRLLLTRTAVQ